MILSLYVNNAYLCLKTEKEKEKGKRKKYKLK